jgi:hypothetical protein
VRLIERDPFARVSLYAERVNDPPGTCEWCGQVRKAARSLRTYLFRFWTDPDAGKMTTDWRLFCGVECRRMHRGE